MSEIQKHIESCRAEDPLAQTMEACGNESDLQAALQPLLVETMQGYEPVATTAPTSPIAELPGVLISIIRRVATKPLTMFGDRPAKQSLLGSLVTTWNAIRQRLAGNPSLGIPDRRADMSAHSLPTSLALLNDRKISEPNAIDGISLAQILCSAYHPTAIEDTTTGWVMTKSLSLSNLTKAYLGCVEIYNALITSMPLLTSLKINNVKKITYTQSVVSYQYKGIIKDLPLCTEFEADVLERVFINGYGSLISDCPLIKKLTIRSLKEFQATTGGGVVYLMDGLEELYLPDFEHVYCDTRENYYAFAMYCAELRKTVVGYGAFYVENGKAYDKVFVDCPKMIHLEYLHEVTSGQKLKGWDPTYVLSTNPTGTDLIEQGSTAENNLQQFLLNFREFIALRLANRKDTTALTLTLSAAVYNAVTGANSGWASLHTLADLGITTDDLTELEQELGITTATLYSTWLDTYTGANGIHWNVNKAN